jgi:hypothetical protein
VSFLLSCGINEEMNECMTQPINLSTYQPINKSTNQPINLSTNQPINLSIYQSINLSTYQPINLSITHSFYGSWKNRHLAKPILTATAQTFALLKYQLVEYSDEYQKHQTTTQINWLYVAESASLVTE